MMMENFRRLAGLTDERTLDAPPWERLTEAEGWERPQMHNPQHYDYTKARYDLTKQQGYADLSKTAKLKLDLKDAVSMAMAVLVTNPKAKTAYIKDPGSVLDAKVIQKEAENWLTGKDDGDASYGAFGFHNNDREIYADGPEVFTHGEWGYEVTSALDQAQNNALEKNPPKVKVSRIKGKTAEGWRIDIDKPHQYYLDVGVKAAEKAAAELAKKGVFPDDNVGWNISYPKALAAKYMQRSPKPGEDCPKCGLEGGHGRDPCETCGTVGGHGCEMCSGEQD